MILAIVLYCLAGSDPSTCTEATALEVRRQRMAQLECLMGSMAVLGADPRASNSTYAKVVCTKPQERK